MALQIIQLGITLVHWFKVLIVCNVREYKSNANCYQNFQEITTGLQNNLSQRHLQTKSVPTDT